ncbi:MAG: polyisoprenoid-binding protein [Rhodospirillales bacterium]|nr:polyisoprenoid-binding protein [Alphaproteobacteria bacterium]USO04227.1 MAG: polyisoprenoid-binding protein [Rhodospirillales bacterium]
MRRPFIAALAFLLLAFSVSPARADVERYDFDKAHTQILFFVNHLGFSNSQGEFHDYDGFIEFNREEPEKSKVEVTIRTSGIDMDDEAWDTHLKSKDFFDVEKFPDMVFKGTTIEITGDKTAKINGELTLLGVTKPVTLDTVFNKAGKHPFSGKYVAGFSAVTNIKRSDFGMEYGLPMIGDDVNIHLEVEGIRQDGNVVNE